MTGTGSSSDNNKNNFWLSNSLELKSSFDRQLEIIHLRNTNIYSYISRDQTFEGTKNSNTTEQGRSQLHIKDVPNKQEQWRSQTDLRFKKSQQECIGKKIPINFSLQDSRFTDRGLVDPYRHHTSLLSRTDCRIAQMSPSSHLRQRAATEDVLALRPLVCSSDFRKGDELDCRDSSFKRHENSSLSGRFSDRFPRSRETLSSGTGSDRTSSISGLDNQQRKVYLDPLPGIGISRNCLEYPDSQEIGPIIRSTGTPTRRKCTLSTQQ